MLLFLFVVILIATACSPTQALQPNVANPASVFCEKNGGKLISVTDASGGTAGMCVFGDNSQCDEWAYFHGECKPGTFFAASTPATVIVTMVTAQSATIVPVERDISGWKIYRNESHNYSFHYPADTQITENDAPIKGLTISGPVIGADSWPSIVISHPSDWEDYRPPEGTDLEQWLTDHNLLMPDGNGDQRQLDVKIAGTTAIHLRHDRSPQSYANDRYYFAWKGQLYMILIGHTDEKEDWGLYNRFLESFQFDQ